MAELSLNIFVQPWGPEKVQQGVDKWHRQVKNVYSSPLSSGVPGEFLLPQI